MSARSANGKINVKLLVLVILVMAAVGVSLVVARQIRRESRVRKALAAGTAAFERQDWPAAVKNLRAYVGRKNDDREILAKYAEACLSLRPLTYDAIRGAISAYHRIIQLDPSADIAYEKLATLYPAVGQFEGLADMARTRLKQFPDDLKAPLWLGNALIQLKKTDEARQVLQAFIKRIEAAPEKQTAEFVQACLLMAGLSDSEGAAQAKTTPTGERPSTPETMAGGADSSKPKTALEWLNEALKHAPDSVEALLARGGLQRRMAGMPATREQDRPALLERARKDLDRADALGSQEPMVRCTLGWEWIAHGEFERAAAELQAVDGIPQKTVQERFLDVNDWSTQRFLLAAELAMRRGAAAEAAPLADEMLKSLTENRHRVQVLPSAMSLYVAAGRIAEARRSLDEYVKILGSLKGSVESPTRLAWLQAMVEMAERRPYAAIESLRPAVTKDSSQPGLLRVLAEAYDQTGQAGQAVGVLLQYLRSYPQDSRMQGLLAKQYSKLGDWSKAFAAAEMAKSLGSTDITVELLRIGAGIGLAVGQADRIDGERLKKLADELADLHQKYPDRVDIRVFQAMVAENLKQPEETERALKLAIEECKEPLKAEMQLAGLYLRTGRRADAIAVCRTAAERNPKVAQPWLTLSDLYMTGTQDYNAAHRSLEEGLKTVEGEEARDSLVVELARLELASGNRDAGMTRLKDLVGSDPREIRGRELLLTLREIQEDSEAAQKLVSELRQIEGETGLSWRFHQASLWFSSRDWLSRQKEIAELLQYCIDADPGSTPPVLLLAGLYEKLGDLRRAEAIYRQALAVNRSATVIADRLLNLLARQGRYTDAEGILPNITPELRPYVFERAGDVSRAIGDLRRTINDDTNKRDAGSRVQLARLLYQQAKDVEQALRYLDEAKAIDPNSRTQVATRASILGKEGRPAEAMQVLDAYVADHNDLEAYWMRAVYLTERGERERAEKDFQKLITFTRTAATGYELLGNFYAETGRLDQAVATAEEGSSKYPENLRLKRRLMGFLLQRAQPQDQERAYEILTVLRKQLPDDVDLTTVEAIRIAQQGTQKSLAKARGMLEEAVKLNPTAVNASLALIQVTMQQGEPKTAAEYADRAMEASPNNTALRIARARTELALGYAANAFRLAREAVQQDPNNTDALTIAAGSAVASGDRGLQGDAQRLIDLAVRRNPTDERLLIARADFYAGVQQPKLAIPQLETYCRTKRSVAALVTLADLYRIADDMEQAEKTIEQAEQLDPNGQTVVHGRFKLLVAQKRLDALGPVIDRYLSAKDQNPATVSEAAATLISLGSKECRNAAVRLLEHAVALPPKSVEERLNLASMLYQTGNADLAEKVYRELLAQYPDNASVLNDFAWVLQEHDHRYAEALELANKGMPLARENLYLHLLDTRGTILSNMPDHLADARKDFQKLADLSPVGTAQQAKAFLQLGRVCVKLGDLAQAKQYVEKALDIDSKVSVFTAEERSEIAKTIEQSGAQPKR